MEDLEHDLVHDDLDNFYDLDYIEDEFITD